VILLGLMLSGSWDTAKTLRNDQDVTYAMPGRREAARQLVADLVSGAVAPEQANGQSAGLQVSYDDDFVQLSGGGSFVRIRREGGDGLVLQAPHGFYDGKTGIIAGQLFDAGYGQVLMVNTVHRYRGDKEVEHEPADVAHLSQSTFQAATLGAAQGLGNALVVQLHGFAERDSNPALAIVASSGAALQPSETVDRAVVALGVFGPVLSGVDFPALSGSKNVQGQALSGSARFLHLELSPSTRETLSDDEERLRAFGDILLELGR
jgi:hypothetical protein